MEEPLRVKLADACFDSNITSACRQFLGAFWLKRGRLMYQL